MAMVFTDATAPHNLRVSVKSGQRFRQSADTVFSNCRAVIPSNPGKFPVAV